MTIGTRAASKLLVTSDRASEHAIELARVIDHMRACRAASLELRRAKSKSRKHERTAGVDRDAGSRRASRRSSPAARRARAPAAPAARPDRACGRTALSPPMTREKNPRRPSDSRMPMLGPSGLFVSTASGPRRTASAEASTIAWIRHGVVDQPAVVDVQESRQRIIRPGAQAGPRQRAAHQDRRALAHHRDDFRQRQRARRRSLRAARRSTPRGRAPNRSACRPDQRLEITSQQS